MCRDVLDIWFRLAGYPAIFSNTVPAKTVPGTEYLSWIVLGPFPQLVQCNAVHLNFKELVSHVDQLFYIY